MYIYVPDCLATKPPVLVCSHYCGGSAAAMFGIAGGGGLVKQADQLGFIMIFPQAVNPDGSGRCWDVGSTKSLTHDGGGDTTAIAQMVKYALGKYGANPDRVYASGTSSGAMMTEALLAIYPDVFKAGVEFSGVPAGCWAVGASSDGTWSGPCAGGQVSHTAAEWGDIARKMYPSYSGHRPRVQLWHGDADTTISFKNHTEGIKQWTNVLGLATDPTSTTTVSYANHQWRRQSWKDTCGYIVLDAWTELSGPHNTDASQNAQYTIPFFGLDQSGPIDPQIAQCDGSSGSDAGQNGNADAGSTDAGNAGGAGGAGGGAAGGGGGSGGGSSDAGSPDVGGGHGGSGGGSGTSGGVHAGGGGGGGGDHGLGPAEGSTGCGIVGGSDGARLGADIFAVVAGLVLGAKGRRRERSR